MRSLASSSTVETGAQRLREIVFAAADGDRLGSEEELMKAVSVARATLRQIARLLEREGCLRVRRGSSGGYFAARPDLDSVKSLVSSYLESLEIETRDVTSVSTALWVEAVRRVASRPNEASAAVCRALLRKLVHLDRDALFLDVAAFEEENGRAMFGLIGGRFIELIFQIGTSFMRARGYPAEVAKGDHTEAHRTFLAGWRGEKQLELEAIARGDVEMAVLAARRMRAIWHARIWGGECSDAVWSGRAA